MISVDEINNELRKIDSQVSESSYGIRHIGDLAMQSLERAQANFSDQQAGRTLINALSLIQAACNDASNCINQVSIGSQEVISRIKL